MTQEQYKLSQVNGMRVSDQELISDLVKVASVLGKGTVSLNDYLKYGTYAADTQKRRFGSWDKALNAAGLEKAKWRIVSEEEFFANLLTLWEHYGRQPRRRELTMPPSTISQGPYNLRFGSWTAALQAFVKFANEMDAVLDANNATQVERRTPRDPSLRLRWQVLHRDNFTCRGCGRSPTAVLGLQLHIDHVVPWSAGGQTLLENLQLLCQDCNLGKSNT